MNEGNASMLPPPSGKLLNARVILETWKLMEMSIEKGKVERLNRLPQNREKKQQQILRY